MSDKSPEGAPLGIRFARATVVVAAAAALVGCQLRDPGFDAPPSSNTQQMGPVATAVMGTPETDRPYEPAPGAPSEVPALRRDLPDLRDNQSPGGHYSPAPRQSTQQENDAEQNEAEAETEYPYALDTTSQLNHYAEEAMQRGDEEAELLSRIAQIPRGTWLVDARSLFRIKDVLEATEGSDKPVLFVGYNAPNRDNGGASAGGAGTLESYERWYTQVREAIGDRKVDFVVEPDALGFAWQSKDPEERKRWVTSVRSAVEVLRESPNIRIFIDATHPDWVPPEEMAALLKEAGILEAPGQVGFAVNVANFQPLGDCEDYVDAIRAELGDEEGIIPAIIDTSRNGNEDLYVQQVVDPDGTVALGVPPQKLGGNMTAAYVKDPSEGDGRRFGAGELIPQRLGEFARNAANLGVEGIEKLVDKV